MLSASLRASLRELRSALRSANFAPRTSLRELRSANFAPRISLHELRSANLVLRTSLHEVRSTSFAPANFSPRTSLRELRSANFAPPASLRELGSANFAPRISLRELRSANITHSEHETPHSHSRKWCVGSQRSYNRDRKSSLEGCELRGSYGDPRGIQVENGGSWCFLPYKKWGIQ